ncbi:MAG: HEAT repeat domain-containing protein [Candidatus Omnitrophica bacterium]|nr:HEAT repeat domain-containing protein [Candidatus Omnitrophota bacterium]
MKPSQVFVSYSSKDRKAAYEICAFLEKCGFGCWIAPRDSRPGEDYAEGIINAIEKAQLLVILLSANANFSFHVKNEVERAVSKRKPIVTLRIEDVQPSKALELFVSSYHWIDIFVPPREEKLHQLEQAVQCVCCAEPEAAVFPGPGSGKAKQTGIKIKSSLIFAITVIFLLIGAGIKAGLDKKTPARAAVSDSRSLNEDKPDLKKEIVAVNVNVEPKERVDPVSRVVEKSPQEEAAVTQLIQQLKDEDWSTRKAAACALGEIKDPRAVEPLIALLKDKYWSVQKAAVYALGEIKDPRAVEPLIALLKDKDWLVREAAACALGEIRDVQAVPALMVVLNSDTDKDVRMSATGALRKIKEEK